MKLIQGDCIEVMKTLEDNSVDTVITDPPYGLEFMGKEWDKFTDNQAFQEWTRLWATEALRVAKPGAMMLCFGGTRTVHRIACGIEDAGWEIRDTMMWLYGSGFPKSYNISKGIDKKAGVEFSSKPAEGVGFMKPDSEDWNVTKNMLTRSGESTEEAKLWDGWGTALKPAFEPIIVAMKPREGTYVENALKYGVAGLNIDGSRVGTEGGTVKGSKPQGKSKGIYGEGLHGACEIDKLNKGRWPANIVHDGSEEVLAGFPEQKSGARKKDYPKSGHIHAGHAGKKKFTTRCNSSEGSAARFFYTAKASKKERNAGLEGMEETPKPYTEFRENWEDTKGHDTPYGGAGRTQKVMKNNHPTVKPLSLMVYLSKLTATPTGGIVLDPFMGSGTTGMACKKVGREFIGIELDEHYFEIAEKRIASVIQTELL